MKGMTLCVCILTLAVACILPSDNGRREITESYLGQKPPGEIPELFAEGMISTPGGNEFCASFSPDGKEFYFNRGLKIMVSTLSEGRWTCPRPVEFSAGSPAQEAHIPFDNQRVYWGWFKDGGYGVFCSERIAGGWSAPRNAGMAGKGFCVTSDRRGELFITRTASGEPDTLCSIRARDGLFVDFIPLTGALTLTEGVVNDRGFRNMAHPGISPDGSYILFDTNGGSHLWVTFRRGDDSWSEAVDLSGYGIDRKFGIATISRDGKYIFMSGDGDIYWVSSGIIDRLKP